jgi:hypothetical protein
VARLEAGDLSGTRVHDAAHGVSNDQGLRGLAHDPQRALSLAGSGVDRRRALRDPLVQSRRLIDRCLWVGTSTDSLQCNIAARRCYTTLFRWFQHYLSLSAERVCGCELFGIIVALS